MFPRGSLMWTSNRVGNAHAFFDASLYLVSLSTIYRVLKSEVLIKTLRGFRYIFVIVLIG